MTTYVLTNGAVWLNGRDFVGKINEIELPEMSWNTIEREGIGDLGTPNYPTRLEELECTVTLVDIVPEFSAIAYDYRKTHFLQFRGNVQKETPNGEPTDLLLKVDLRGKFKQANLGSHSANEPLEGEHVLTCTYVKETFDGRDLLEVDILRPLYIVEGRDLAAPLRRNLGRA